MYKIFSECCSFLGDILSDLRLNQQSHVLLVLSANLRQRINHPRILVEFKKVMFRFGPDSYEVEVFRQHYKEDKKLQRLFSKRVFTERHLC